MIEALVNHVAAGGLGTPGTDLFIGLMPAGSAGTMFRHAGGDRDPELPGLRRIRFQAVTSAPDYPAAYAAATAIADRLLIRNTEIGAFWVYQCDPRHDPVPLEREESGVYTFVVNYDAIWRQL